MMKKQIEQVLKKYDPKNIRIGVLGSHSALKLLLGPNRRALKLSLSAKKVGIKHTLNTTAAYSTIPCFLITLMKSLASKTSNS